MNNFPINTGWVDKPTSEGFWLYQADKWPFMLHWSPASESYWAYGQAASPREVTKDAFPGKWFQIVIPPIDGKA